MKLRLPRITRSRVIKGFATATILFFLMVGIAYSQKDRYGYKVMEVSHKVLGDRITWEIEGQYFAAADHAKRINYRLFGGQTHPDPINDQGLAFAGERTVNTNSSPILEVHSQSIVTDTPVLEKEAEITPVDSVVESAPAWVLPETRPQQPWLDANGFVEGRWDTDHLPNPPWRAPIMATTFIRPDTSRPYAFARVLVLDKRYIRLHVVTGTVNGGPGVIDPSHYRYSEVYWNGAFKIEHGDWGMKGEDGRIIAAPFQQGLTANRPTIGVTTDWSIQMGMWGQPGLTNPDSFYSIRQNGKAFLVDKCQLGSRINEGNDTWGYVEAGRTDLFITWRSGIGLTANGDLIYAAGNNLSAASLARALWAAGACQAMQLDINSPYVLASLLYPQFPPGIVKSVKLSPDMPDNPERALTRQERDFMFVTLDEGRNP